MQKFDPLILKQNVSMLIKKKGIPQQKLADAIGMSQSNISKALNLNDKKCFTVEQVYAIARYFHVSTDSLLGYEIGFDNFLSSRSIGSFMASLLNSGKVKYTPGKIGVDDLTDFYLDTYYNGQEGVSYSKRTVILPHFYFPNHWDPDDGDSEGHSSDELSEKAINEGNDTGNTELNVFLEKYRDILDLYHKGKLPREAYEIVLRNYLDEIPE